MTARHVLFGALFGFVLVRAGATDYDAIAGMFRLVDLHLVGVMAVAIAGSGVGFALMRRAGVRARGGAPLALAAKPMQRGLIAGGLLFGVGWGLAGTCPGTSLAMIGQGKLAGLVTFAGILVGAWLGEARTRARAPVATAASAAQNGPGGAGGAGGFSPPQTT